MKKPVIVPRKLALIVETVRTLDGATLRDVAGGRMKLPSFDTRCAPHG